MNLLAKPEQKLSLLKLICSEFAVNEKWLIEGVGDMFLETKETYIDKLVQQYSLDEIDKKMLTTYIELPDEHRKIIKNYLMSITSIIPDDNHVSDDIDIDKELELYKKELEQEKKAKGKLSVSTYTKEEKNA